MPVLWGHPKKEENSDRESGPMGDIYQYAKWFRLHKYDFHIENNDGEWCCCAWPTSGDYHYLGYSSEYFPTYDKALQACYEGVKRIIQQEKEYMDVAIPPQLGESR